MWPNTTLCIKLRMWLNATFYIIFSMWPKNDALYKVTNVTKCDILRIGPNATFYITFCESHCFGFVEARHFKSSFGNKKYIIMQIKREKMGLQQYIPMLLAHFMSLQNFAKTFKFGNESVENRNKSIKYSNIRKKILASHVLLFRRRKNRLLKRV